MDSARLTDNTGREADFRNVIVIMTTNAGAREMQENVVGFNAAKDLNASGRALEKVFAPEFRNRLDATVTFAPLPMEAVLHVVDKFVAEIEAQLIERQVSITLDEAAKKWAAEKGYDELMGARPLARVLQRELKEALAEEILFGELEHGGTAHFTLDTETDRLVQDRKSVV